MGDVDKPNRIKKLGEFGNLKFRIILIQFGWDNSIGSSRNFQQRQAELLFSERWRDKDERWPRPGCKKSWEKLAAQRRIGCPRSVLPKTFDTLGSRNWCF